SPLDGATAPAVIARSATPTSARTCAGQGSGRTADSPSSSPSRHGVGTGWDTMPQRSCDNTPAEALARGGGERVVLRAGAPGDRAGPGAALGGGGEGAQGEGRRGALRRRLVGRLDRRHDVGDDRRAIGPGAAGRRAAAATANESSGSV